MLDHFSVHEVVDMTPQCNAVRYFDILVLYTVIHSELSTHFILLH